MTRYKTPEEFIEFLKKKKAYRQFKDRIDPFFGNLDTVLKKNMAWTGLTSDCFLWSDTEEGFQFWSDIDEQWISFCHGRTDIDGNKI